MYALDNAVLLTDNNNKKDHTEFLQAILTKVIITVVFET